MRPFSLKQTVSKNQSLRSSANLFVKNPDAWTARSFAVKTLEATESIGKKESELVFRAAHMLLSCVDSKKDLKENDEYLHKIYGHTVFTPRSFMYYNAWFYALEAKKDDFKHNSYLAANEYFRVANTESYLNTVVPCLHSAFYCSLDAGKPELALKAAKTILRLEVRQGMAELFFATGRMYEEKNDPDTAFDYYKSATDGEYFTVLKAKEATERLTPKLSPYRNPSTPINRQRNKTD